MWEGKWTGIDIKELLKFENIRRQKCEILGATVATEMRPCSFFRHRAFFAYLCLTKLQPFGIVYSVRILRKAPSSTKKSNTETEVSGLVFGPVKPIFPFPYSGSKRIVENSLKTNAISNGLIAVIVHLESTHSPVIVQTLHEHDRLSENAAN